MEALLPPFFSRTRDELLLTKLPHRRARSRSFGLGHVFLFLEVAYGLVCTEDLPLRLVQAELVQRQLLLRPGDLGLGEHRRLVLQAQFPQDLRHAALCVIGAAGLALEPFRGDRKRGTEPPGAVVLARHEMRQQLLLHVRERALAAVAVPAHTWRRVAGAGGGGRGRGRSEGFGLTAFGSGLEATA